MPRVSAGLLLYRIRNSTLEVLLAHPGGPYFRNKDEGAWTVPKGEIEPEEDMLQAARREFQEEIGVSPEGPFHPLAPIKQKGGKIVHAWACAGDLDPAAAVSNTFSIEWPPRSGTMQEFPEVDEVRWFDLDEARVKIQSTQIPLLDELEAIVAGT